MNWHKYKLQDKDEFQPSNTFQTFVQNGKENVDKQNSNKDLYSRILKLEKQQENNEVLKEKIVELQNENNKLQLQFQRLDKHNDDKILMITSKFDTKIEQLYQEVLEIFQKEIKQMRENLVNKEINQLYMHLKKYLNHQKEIVQEINQLKGSSTKQPQKGEIYQSDVILKRTRDESVQDKHIQSKTNDLKDSNLLKPEISNIQKSQQILSQRHQFVQQFKDFKNGESNSNRVNTCYSSQQLKSSKTPSSKIMKASNIDQQLIEEKKKKIEYGSFYKLEINKRLQEDKEKRKKQTSQNKENLIDFRNFSKDKQVKYSIAKSIEKNGFK